MRKIAKSLACVVICGMSVSAAELIWDIKYDADILPTAAGSAKQWDRSTSTYKDLGAFARGSGTVTTESVSGGIFSANSIDQNSAVGWTRPLAASGDLAPDSSKGYTVELRLNVIDVDTEDQEYAVFSCEEGTTGVSRFWSLKVKDKNNGTMDVGLVGLGASVQWANVTKDAFHTYRVLALDTGTQLYIDGSTTPVNSIVQAHRDLSRNAFSFGDFTGAKDASIELDYLGIYTDGAVVPPSKTISLILLGKNEGALSSKTVVQL